MGADARPLVRHGTLKVRLLLAGDVMTGRGIDQILEHPVDPVIHERWAKSAIEYVRLAEERNGPIHLPVEPAYVWGDALEIADGYGAEARIINLETAVTSVGSPWPRKGVHYRMHPENIGCITAGRVDCCVLANNHVLDWSEPGLEQTLATLDTAGLLFTGAGLGHEEAWRPAVIETGSGTRVAVIGIGSASSGIPADWEAVGATSGVALAGPRTTETAVKVARFLDRVRGESDLVVASIHWGPNWGYEIGRHRRELARRLIDEAGVDIVHGHSSHHPLAIEVYRGRAILYGCGDLINDYEGIRGHEDYHPDLRVLYLLDLDPSNARLQEMQLVPMTTRRFRLETAAQAETDWLASRLARGNRELGTSLEASGDGRLRLRW